MLLLGSKQGVLGVVTILGILFVLVIIGLRVENLRTQSRLQQKRDEFRSIQEQVQRGMANQKLVETLVRELSPLSFRSSEVRDLLNHYGVPISPKTSPPSP